MSSSRRLRCVSHRHRRSRPNVLESGSRSVACSGAPPQAATAVPTSCCLNRDSLVIRAPSGAAACGAPPTSLNRRRGRDRTVGTNRRERPGPLLARALRAYSAPYRRRGSTDREGSGASPVEELPHVGARSDYASVSAAPIGNPARVRLSAIGSATFPKMPSRRPRLDADDLSRSRR